jgi:ABC-2 type transport system permease protein
MPAVFILIMSLALRDAMDPDRVALGYLWLDEDGGYFAGEVSAALAARQNLVRLPVATSPSQLLARLRAGEAAFGLRIAAGLDQRIADAAPARAPLVQMYLSPTAPPYARLLFVAHVRAALARAQAEYLMEDEMGVPHDEARALRDRADPALIPADEIVLGVEGATSVAPNAVQQSVPAWLVFAMFFVVLPMATSVLTERAQGTAQRLALLNVSPARLLAAKFPAYYVVNLVQLGVMLLVGVFAVPRLGGDALAIQGSPVALWLVASALSVAAIGFALLIAVLARSTVQATTMGGVANLLLGALGGVMVPKLVMPPAMQAASVVSPMSWALDACWDILLRGGGLVDVIPEVLALAAFGLLCYAAASALYPRIDR